MAAVNGQEPEVWTADEWLAWLRRKPGQPIPHQSGLNDCADALAAELDRLRHLVPTEG